MADLRLVGLAVALLALVPSVVAQSGASTVLVTDIDGTVTRGTAIQVEDAIEQAEDAGAPLVIRLDTPGGVVSSTLEIDRAIARAGVPVLTYVGPSGAWAQSAGTFIFLMGHPNGMAPDTQIGSAQPITQSGSGGTQNASEKVTNALVEKIRGIADRNGRNQTTAKHFITRNLNLNASEANRRGMADHVSPDLRSFLQAVHGSQARVGDDTVTLDTADAQIQHVERGFLSQLVEIIGNPQVAFVLFLVGLYGVIFGLAAPGTFVPETIGALALILGLIGLGLFDAGTSGLLLILLAAAFFIAEVFTPTHGVLTTAGVVALVLGAVFLLDEPLLSKDFLERFQIVALISAIVTGGVVLGAVAVALRTRDQPTRDDYEGRTAQTLEELAPDGQVLFHGERWQAHAEEGPIPEDVEVEIVDREGLHLTVRAIEEERDGGRGAEASLIDPEPDQEA